MSKVINIILRAKKGGVTDKLWRDYVNHSKALRKHIFKALAGTGIEFVSYSDRGAVTRMIHPDYDYDNHRWTNVPDGESEYWRPRRKDVEQQVATDPRFKGMRLYAKNQPYELSINRQGKDGKELRAKFKYEGPTAEDIWKSLQKHVSQHLDNRNIMDGTATDGNRLLGVDGQTIDGVFYTSVPRNVGGNAKFPDDLEEITGSEYLALQADKK